MSRAQYAAIGGFDLNFRVAADHDYILRMLARYPGKHHPLALTVMSQGGESGRSIAKTCADFRDVTVKRGFPRFLAWPLYFYKVLNWSAKIRLGLWEAKFRAPAGRT